MTIWRCSRACWNAKPHSGADHRERLANIAELRAEKEADLSKLKARWTEEKQLVDEIRGIRARIETAHAAIPGAAPAAAPAEDLSALRAVLAERTASLEALQGETPLMRVSVDASIVGEVISGWTGVPVGKMLRDQLSMVLQMEKLMGARIIGQDAGYRNHRAPHAHVGGEDRGSKQAEGRVHAGGPIRRRQDRNGAGDERSVVRWRAQHHHHQHERVSGVTHSVDAEGLSAGLCRLRRRRCADRGGPARRPYSVVLLDEVEKAHPDVLELFFQVFDKGVMDDGEGRQIDFKNSIILLTTNAGTDTIMTLTADPETMPDSPGLVLALKPELNKVFKPAFLGRMVIVPYFPVRDENLKKIVRLKLNKIARRLRETHKMTLKYDDALVDAVTARCTEVESGARNVDNILSNTMLPEISKRLLEALSVGEHPSEVRVSVDDSGEFAYDVTDGTRSAHAEFEAAVAGELKPALAT